MLTVLLDVLNESLLTSRGLAFMLQFTPLLSKSLMQA